MEVNTTETVLGVIVYLVNVEIDLSENMHIF